MVGARKVSFAGPERGLRERFAKDARRPIDVLDRRGHDLGMPSVSDLEHGGVGLGQTMTGTVRWFKNEKGYGRITGDDDYFYFVHFSSIEMEDYRRLEPGQR